MKRPGRRWFGRFDVVRMFADPWGWHSEVDEWAREYGEAVVLRLPTNSTRRFAPCVDRFRTAIAEGAISHDADPDLGRHLLNARLARGAGRADDDRPMFTLEKPGRGRFIDAAVASVLAFEAVATAPPAATEATPPQFAWA